MDRKDKEKLQKYYSTLLEVTYSSISPHLISNFVLTLDMHDEIDSKPTERMKMEKFLRILPTRGDNAMKELINALKPSHSWIAKKLENESISSRRGNQISLSNDAPNFPDMSIANHVRDISRILQTHARMSSHWAFLANSMRLLPTTVMDIKRDMVYSGGCEYAIYTILDAWVSKVGGSKATFSKLISLLQGEGMNHCGEEVREYWATLTLDLCQSENTVSQSQPTNRRDRSRSPVVTDV